MEHNIDTFFNFQSQLQNLLFEDCLCPILAEKNVRSSSKEIFFQLPSKDKIEKFYIVDGVLINNSHPSFKTILINLQKLIAAGIEINKEYLFYSLLQKTINIIDCLLFDYMLVNTTIKLDNLNKLKVIAFNSEKNLQDLLNAYSSDTANYIYNIFTDDQLKIKFNFIDSLIQLEGIFRGDSIDIIIFLHNLRAYLFNLFILNDKLIRVSIEQSSDLLINNSYEAYFGSLYNNNVRSYYKQLLPGVYFDKKVINNNEHFKYLLDYIKSSQQFSLDYETEAIVYCKLDFLSLISQKLFDFCYDQSGLEREDIALLCLTSFNLFEHRLYPIKEKNESSLIKKAMQNLKLPIDININSWSLFLFNDIFDNNIYCDSEIKIKIQEQILLKINLSLDNTKVINITEGNIKFKGNIKINNEDLLVNFSRQLLFISNINRFVIFTNWNSFYDLQIKELKNTISAKSKHFEQIIQDFKQSN